MTPSTLVLIGVAALVVCIQTVHGSTIRDVSEEKREILAEFDSPLSDIAEDFIEPPVMDKREVDNKQTVEVEKRGTPKVLDIKVVFEPSAMRMFGRGQADAKAEILSQFGKVNWALDRMGGRLKVGLWGVEFSNQDIGGADGNKKLSALRSSEGYSLGNTYDAVMLITGINLFRVFQGGKKGDILGIANTCQPCGGAGISELKHGVLVLAHEIGHLLGAYHDSGLLSWDIMAGGNRINEPNLTFSDQSKKSILSCTQRWSCWAKDSSTVVPAPIEYCQDDSGAISCAAHAVGNIFGFGCKHCRKTCKLC